MGVLAKACGCVGVTVALVAVLLGLFLSGGLKRAGVFKMVARSFPSRVGMAPCFVDEGEWGYSYARVAAANLTGQVAVVTGANSGVGFWTSLHLARQGATVVMACRTPSKCERAAATIRANATTGTGQHHAVETMTIDTSSLASVRAFANAFLASPPARKI